MIMAPVTLRLAFHSQAEACSGWLPHHALATAVAGLDARGTSNCLSRLVFRSHAAEARLHVLEAEIRWWGGSATSKHPRSHGAPRRLQLRGLASTQEPTVVAGVFLCWAALARPRP